MVDLPYRNWYYFTLENVEIPAMPESDPRKIHVAVAATGQASVTGNAYVAQTPEQFTYNAYGNLSRDGCWS
jgi:hypothetical protein